MPDFQSMVDLVTFILLCLFGLVTVGELFLEFLGIRK